MNNKIIGTQFERRFVEMLAKRGFWVHFIEPNRQGAQPFDIIAIKDDKPYAFDCKTSVRNKFSYNRLEVNQVSSFTKLRSVGCEHIYISVLYDDDVYLIRFEELMEKGQVELNGNNLFK